MTEQEYQDIQARLTEGETEIAALALREREYIDKAREFNDLRRATGNKRTALDAELKPLREAALAHVQEQRRIQQERMRKEAEEKAAARAKADAEAAAAKAKEASELEATKAELEKVKAELAAKG